ncbi:MAG TPA: hypothetical protein VFI42_09505 [Thermomicrobiaceae bacterium]|nr:hypothetical protein [Thermomicrobiaceae bacterium]
METKEQRAVDERPIACSLTLEEQRSRREDLTMRLLAASTGSSELDDGYEFVFPGDAAWASEILRFVVDERDCCRFFAFEIIFEPNLGPIRLRLRGPDGTKAFLAEWSDGSVEQR